MLREGVPPRLATLPWMQCQLSVIRPRAAYRMLSAPTLGGRPCGGRANVFPLSVVVCAILPHGLRRRLPCAYTVRCFLLQVLQHTAAAAGLHGQWRVSCQLAAGLLPCVVLAQLAVAPLGGAAEARAALGSLRLLLTGWLLV